MAPYVFIKIVCYLYISSFAVQMYGNTWENHHCEKHGNTQISPNLSH
jgi:hypothetical protein